MSLQYEDVSLVIDIMSVCFFLHVLAEKLTFK